VFSRDCGLDLGGTSLRWIENVSSAASLALLDSLVRKNVKGLEWEDSYSRKIADEAMLAISMHADPQANKLLENYIMSEGPRKLREQALFWAGMERGRSGFELVRNFARSGQGDSKLREHATFVLSQSREEEALTELINMAKKDADTHVRGQAIFWLGQKAGKKAADAIGESLNEDPDEYVKKKAVFALSQMPREEGVPRLIQVAKTNKNPKLRKEAMFWLGQTGDPRALAFFEEVLTK
jgi:HEAT repeat protein